MRIGLYGGRFDPPHLGHLLLAETAREALGLDQVWFLPARDPPHKPTVAPAEVRLAMTTLALRAHPGFFPSRLELERNGPSYGVETVEHVRAAFPTYAFAFLLGADAFRDIGTWHRPHDLLGQVRLAVVTRPGADADEAPEPFRSAATRVPGIPFGVSGTDLRRRLREGRSVRYLLPAPVARYLAEHPQYARTEGGTS